jgi:hypothetical protein
MGEGDVREFPEGSKTELERWGGEDGWRDRSGGRLL